MKYVVTIIQCLFLALFFGARNGDCESKKVTFPPGYKFMTDEEYERAKQNQDKFHNLLRRADSAAKLGSQDEAVKLYLKAISFSEGSSSEGVARGAAARYFEKIDKYDGALQQAEWCLQRLKEGEPVWVDYSEMKKRLLKKIEAQKRGEKIEDPNPAQPEAGKIQPIQKVSDFHKADYASQKQFLEKELPEDTEIHRLSKQAMLAEHAGKFGEAKKYYEAMLLRKEEMIAAYQEGGWVMLHPAIQRMSEMTGDEAREKEMLIWINSNMLSDQGAYHKYLNGLLPDVQDHLRKRIKKLNLH